MNTGLAALKVDVQRCWPVFGSSATTEPHSQTYHMLELFGNVLDTVERQYVTPVDDKKLIQASLKGMLTSLDPHSDYLTPEDYQDMEDQTRGEYGGLGIEITSDVADGPHSVILNQVTNGVAIRMAVLYLLSGNTPKLAEAAKGAP